jgi:pimeloyl-ACP methyl ester carboxylesterase
MVTASRRRREFKVTDDLLLVADEFGRGAKLVLLLHGGGQTRHAWQGTADALGRAGYRALSVDARGHGDSDWSPRGEYRLDDFARDLVVVIDQLGTAPVLVGASLGGLAALLVAGEMAPGTARGLVLVDVVPRIEHEGAERIHAFMVGDGGNGFATLEEAASAVAAYLPHRARDGVPEGLAKNLRQGPDGRWRWHWDPRFLGPDGVSAVLDADRLRACTRRLALPTLLVRGRMSDIVSEEGAREFLEDVDGAEFVDVSGAGHMVAGDRNDRFTAAVVDFLVRKGI